MILGMNKDNRTLLMTCGFVLLAAQMQFVILNSMRLSGISLGYFILTGVMYALFYIGFGVLKLFESVHEDEIYVLMSVSSKLSLSWLLIGNVFEGFKELGETTNPDFTDLDWRAIQWIVVIFSLLVLVIGIPLIVNRDTNGATGGALGFGRYRTIRSPLTVWKIFEIIRHSSRV